MKTSWTSYIDRRRRDLRYNFLLWGGNPPRRVDSRSQRGILQLLGKTQAPDNLCVGSPFIQSVHITLAKFMCVWKEHIVRMCWAAQVNIVSSCALLSVLMCNRIDIKLKEREEGISSCQKCMLYRIDIGERGPTPRGFGQGTPVQFELWSLASPINYLILLKLLPSSISKPADQ